MRVRYWTKYLMPQPCRTISKLLNYPSTPSSQPCRTFSKLPLLLLPLLSTPAQILVYKFLSCCPMSLPEGREEPASQRRETVSSGKSSLGMPGRTRAGQRQQEGRWEDSRNEGAESVSITCLGLVASCFVDAPSRSVRP